MAEFSGVEVLQSEIEKSKDKLRGYNENIRKLTGRDPSRPGIRRLLSGEGIEREERDFSSRAARGRARIFGLARHGIMEDTGPPAKRRVVGGAFSRLGPVPARRREREDSPYEEELPNKLSVHSSVVATSREAKNRKEILQEQTDDKEGMQRNRRMFGLLLGTLNKFKTESKTLETKEVQRKKIEEKLEENAEKEKRKFKMRTKLLIEEMHLEQSKISRLQQKMELVQEHADREAEVKKLKNFIVTKTKPRIFWKPQQMYAALENKWKESKKFVDGMLQESRDRLEKEIMEQMERENKREERIKMRLREDGLLEEEEELGEAGDERGGKKEGDGNWETGRVVVEVKEENNGERSVTDRLGRRFEEGGLGHENEEAGDLRKKPRRTVVVERRESSESESGDEMEPEGNGKDNETDKSNSQDKHRTDLDREVEASNKDIHSSADELEAGKRDGKTDRSYSSKPRDDRELENRREVSENESSDSDVEIQRPRECKRNEDKDNHRNIKGRSQNDSRKDRKKDKKEGSKERDRDSRRRDGDKKKSRHDSGDKGKSRRHRHEERRDKERSKKDSHGGGKKHSSRHTKDSQRHSDSDESDVEIKLEKEISLNKNKDQGQSESLKATEGDKIQRKSKNSSAEEDVEMEVL